MSDPRAILRARIVLRAVEGQTNREIARQEQVTERTVRLWRLRFTMGRVAALYLDAPRPGRPRRLRQDEERTLANLVRGGAPMGLSLSRIARTRKLPKTTLWRISKRSYPGGQSSRQDVDALAELLGLSRRQSGRYFPEYWQKLHVHCESEGCDAPANAMLGYRAGPHRGRATGHGTHFTCDAHSEELAARIRRLPGFISLSRGVPFR